MLKLDHLLADDLVRLARHRRMLGRHVGDCCHETLLCSRYLRQRFAKNVLQILRNGLKRGKKAIN